MNYTWNNPYGIIDQDLFNQHNITLFFKRIQKYKLSISTIRKLDEILKVPLSFAKKMFYRNIFNKNIH